LHCDRILAAEKASSAAHLARRRNPIPKRFLKRRKKRRMPAMASKKRIPDALNADSSNKIDAKF
jgi:hypothetical protein